MAHTETLPQKKSPQNQKTVPQKTSQPPRRIAVRAHHLHIPAHDGGDLEVMQRRNRDGARRRLRNVEQKIAEARMMLADAPPEVDRSVRDDLWMVLQVIRRTNQKLLLKRGRKPRTAANRPPGGQPQDKTTLVAL